ncbi:MAG: DUF2283 domain-containing protein [Dehalococcoidia bacterium]|nr:DUF2283 domain-containing protein [Dehalococcoidia bacterium]
MKPDALTPSLRFNPEGFSHVHFVYEAEDDIAFVHLDGPRPATSIEVDDAWYLRVADGEIVGLELHGLKRIFLSTPFFAQVFKPAMAELEARTGRRFFGEDDADADDIDASGSVAELRRTTDLLLLMIGQATAKHDEIRRARMAEEHRERVSL